MDLRLGRSPGYSGAACLGQARAWLCGSDLLSIREGVEGVHPARPGDLSIVLV